MKYLLIESFLTDFNFRVKWKAKHNSISNSFKPENRGGGKFDTQKNNSMSEQFQPKNRGGGKLNTQNTYIQYTHFPGLIETIQ